MESLVLLVMLSACAAAPLKDMSEYAFVFPKSTKTDYVELKTTPQNFSALTVCHRSISDLKRDHGIFSMATRTNNNAFLLFWEYANADIELYVLDQRIEFSEQNYKQNSWHAMCTTWQSSSGIVQFWLDGRPSVKRAVTAGANITGPVTIVLGQDQDAIRGGFEFGQSFVGMMTDVYIWDYILSPCEIQQYVDDRSLTPGNVLNWRALDYQIEGQILVESKKMTCD